MKIAVWHNLPSGGGKRALHYHVKGLLERGHTVEAWCPQTADQTYLPLEEMIPQHVVPLEVESGRAPWTRKLRRPPGPYYAIRRRQAAMERHCRECAAQIHAGGFDVLLGGSCFWYGAAPIARFVDLPSVLYLQEPFRPLYEAIPTSRWATREVPLSPWSPAGWRETLLEAMVLQALRIQVREEARSAAAYDTILVNSLFSRESVRRAYNLDSKVCSLGVDTDLFRPSGAAKERFVIGLGSVGPTKGLEAAIRAVAALDADGRPPFVWVGNYSDPDYQGRVEALAGTLGVNLRVRERVSDAELTDLLSRAAVLLYTSRLEPFGFAPLEANACGTPAVAVAEGGIRETVIDGVNGFLVGDDEPRALGAALQRLLDAPEEAAEMGRRARRHVVETWGWDHAVDRLERHLAAAARSGVAAGREYAHA